MFRNPRENQKLPSDSQLTPSTGRPPSPPLSVPVRAAMATKSSSKTATARSKSTPTQAKMMQTTLVPSQWGKKSPATTKSKPKVTTNGNIMTFFKKAEELNSTLFMRERGGYGPSDETEFHDNGLGWGDANNDPVLVDSDTEDKEDNARYNEKGGSNKKRKISEERSLETSGQSPYQDNEEFASDAPQTTPTESVRIPRRTGPFLDDSDSEEEEQEIVNPRIGTNRIFNTCSEVELSKTQEEPIQTIETTPLVEPVPDHRPPLKHEVTSHIEADDVDEFDDLEDDDLLEGEEYDERRWMEEQQRLETAAEGGECDFEDEDVPLMFPNDASESIDVQRKQEEETPSCPICNASLEGLTEQESSMHVNACLDGNPLPAPEPKIVRTESKVSSNNHRIFKKPTHPARPGQENPFTLEGNSNQPKSAFSKLMSSHAEDAAWANAAAAETAARGKPSFKRTCPFYKIMPGLYICVDAFRYGAVKGQSAYFLSHFHSDHYVGLTASWSHGPIYCSKVTANLVKQQLRVDPKWVVALEFEKKTEVPGTEGVNVTMISANHCPGSSLFLFEKNLGNGATSKLQRVLHCGDFRACQEHIEHPLLKPEVLDVVSGKNKQQKLDVCYLDTTYLNPKYAFPPQQQVIQACADMCVSLNKERADENDEWEQVKRDRAGKGMIQFVQKNPDVPEENEESDGEDIDAMKITKMGSTKRRGRLLVVVGTYSIGKERICVGVAKALNSRIYAAPNKQKICHALEDPELNALLTTNPREAQVHMTPLFEIRADTLDDYLRDYRDRFSRVVGFRPSGWNYRPPKSRFTESPLVQTVLHSQNWKSQFAMKDLTPQQGSTKRASCFGVPYSEHSSFRELTMFCCALRIDKIIPTVNVGNAKSREKMKSWCEKWAQDKKKNGLFRVGENESEW
ncbi:DNA repair metallo-beta-lactamase-domain-containing protein [Dendryphion nanum]|uniref:DNA repair metallo-beta-lactamase-domain-containing protein n=1 Tax=Dendryphion nanum TaxID=256645 RepID=A0A9P9DSV8_9PLEO|nr:DNA repair metallo-beta-lactamase-domain-containing protein [Dendryphion nanum]